MIPYKAKITPSIPPGKIVTSVNIARHPSPTIQINGLSNIQLQSVIAQICQLNYPDNVYNAVSPLNSLGKYAMDCFGLEQIGYIKSGTIAKVLSDENIIIPKNEILTLPGVRNDSNFLLTVCLPAIVGFSTLNFRVLGNDAHWISTSINSFLNSKIQEEYLYQLVVARVSDLINAGIQTANLTPDIIAGLLMVSITAGSGVAIRIFHQAGQSNKTSSIEQPTPIGRTSKDYVFTGATVSQLYQLGVNACDLGTQMGKI